VGIVDGDLASRWGALWNFADKDLVCTCDPSQILLLRWETPGEILRMFMQNEYGTSVTVFRIGPDGRRMNDSYWVTIEKDGTLTPQLKEGNSRSAAQFDRPWTVDADGSVIVSRGTLRKPTSFRYRIDGDQLVQESNRKGQWKVNLARREIRAGDSKAERLAATLRQQARLQAPGKASLAEAATTAFASQDVAHQDATAVFAVQAAALAPATTVVAEAQPRSAARVEPAKSWTEIRNGTFVSQDGARTIVVMQRGDRLVIRDPLGQAEYRRHPDGNFQAVEGGKIYGVRIVDSTTVDFFRQDLPRTSRYTRLNGDGAQAQELAYGYFKNLAEPNKDGLVIRLDGDKAVTATASDVAEYHRQTDGTFRYFDSVGKATHELRINDKYTVEFRDLLSARTPTRMSRVGNAPQNYIAEAWRNEQLANQRYREAEARWYAEQDALDAEWEAEQAAIEAEAAYEDDYGASTGSTGANILQGFMKGLSEATASNQAMEQSMQDAANRGMAEGAAEYARRQAEIAREKAEQRRADAEYAREVRKQEAAERQARRAAEQARLAEAERARKVQLAANSGGSGNADVESAKKVDNAEALSEKSVRVWLAVPMKWKEGNTINPQCFSNIFTVNIAYDPKGWGNAGRMSEAVGSLESSFLEKCSQHGQTDGSVEWYAEGISNQFERQRQHPQDYLVDM
jgi:hypothetical protein